MSFLTNINSSKLKQTRDFNLINGSDAESLAASKMILACRGEVRWGSREEDNRKIDLMISYEHPWFNKERQLLLVQVKSGDSYGHSILDKGFKLKNSLVNDVKRSSYPICVLWIDRSSNEVYWAFIRPNTKRKTYEFGKQNKLNPSIIFDLSRLLSKDTSYYLSGGKGVIIKERLNNISEQRKQAKNVYRKLKIIKNPIIGEINFTRYAWRHMFRSGRSLIYKNTSLNLIHYFDVILNQKPSSYTMLECNEMTISNYNLRRTEYLFKYDDIKILTGKKITKAVIYFRILEDISFPINWNTNSMLSQQIKRIVVLKSAYYKYA